MVKIKKPKNIFKFVSIIVLVLIITLVYFVLFNALFTPTNTAVTSLNSTLNTAGYSNEASIAVTAWQIILIGIPLVLMAVGIALVISFIIVVGIT